MAKLTVAQQKAKVAATIKVNGNKEITPPKDKILRDDQLDSSPNWKDGGLQYENEVGYLTEFDVTDPKAFTPKKQVDEIVQQAISEIPTGDFLPRDGSLPMTGPLELSGDATQPLEAVPLQQAESIVEDAINEGNFLPRDGSLAMEGDLDLDNHVLKQMSYIRNFDGTWNKLLDFIGNTGSLSVGVQNLLATIYSRQFFDALNKEYKLEVGDEDEGEYVRILLDLVNGFQFSTGQYYSRHNTNSYTGNQDIDWPNKGGIPAFLDDQATDLLLGLVKLYATTGSNTDGAITQKAITDLLNALRTLPAYPGNDNQEYELTILNGVVVWSPVTYVKGTSLSNKNKLKAGAAGDWSASQDYIGATSGALSGTKGGEKFKGQDATNNNWYLYESLGGDLEWTRTLQQ